MTVDYGKLQEMLSQIVSIKDEKMKNGQILNRIKAKPNEHSDDADFGPVSQSER